ncbi:hypothetical protein C0Q70_18906 [Pomacea canaliculata]|uniref:guanylate cyclase n=1 Tax=Pomacea canaliculata TaxID=400727 RepID=A0A2T7NHW3_POMCA|nr:hypothetical protein C0Q70_18906 [Pomacea canaliculata]
MIENDEWDIPIEEIVFYEDRQGTSSGKSQMHSFQLLLQILQWPGKWKAHQVGVRLLEVSELRSVNRELKKCMLWLRDTVLHPNVVRFYGLTEVELDRYVIGEYCAKGSMVDILHSDKYNFNNDFKLSLSTDIASGMAFLHASGVVHGLLCSACCMIDARWTVKVGDWEFVKMLTAAVPTKRTLQLLRSKDDDNHANPLRDFWDPTFASDVYSFSIILQEVYTREDPYAELADTMTSEEVIRAVCFNHLRPAPTDDTPVRVRQIMEIAWTENPAARPNFDQIVKMLRQSRSTRKSVLDSMMEAMEEYTLHLEERVAERSAEAGVAKHNLETLLADLVPRHLVSRLASGGSLQPQTLLQPGHRGDRDRGPVFRSRACASKGCPRGSPRRVPLPGGRRQEARRLSDCHKI